LISSVSGLVSATMHCDSVVARERTHLREVCFHAGGGRREGWEDRFRSVARDVDFDVREGAPGILTPLPPPRVVGVRADKGRLPALGIFRFHVFVACCAVIPSTQDDAPSEQIVPVEWWAEAVKVQGCSKTGRAWSGRWPGPSRTGACGGCALFRHSMQLWNLTINHAREMDWRGHCLGGWCRSPQSPKLAGLGSEGQ